MKNVFFLIACSIALTCPAQQQRLFDTVFANTVMQEPFARDKKIIQVNYFYDFQASRYISTFLYNDTGKFKITQSTYYNLNFIGDRYLYEKNYGTILLPLKEINTAINKKCGEPFYLSLSAKPDSIHINLRSYCPPKNDDERVFTKVEVFGGYRYGMKAFENRIQSILDQKYFPAEVILKDSIYLFNIVVARKDSCVMRAGLLDGAASFFTQVIVEELTKVCSWLPPLAGGIPVNAYRKIYVRLNSDKKVTVSYPEN